MKKFIKIFMLALLTVPGFVMAQTNTATPLLDTLGTIITAIKNIVEILTPIAFVLILLAFFWGLAKFVMNAGNEEKKAEGKQLMIYGVIALFVAASIWGIVNVLQSTFNIPNGAGVVVPNPAGQIQNILNTNGGSQIDPFSRIK